MDTPLTVSDRHWLHAMGVAVDEKDAKYQKWLAEQNLTLAHSVQNWIEQAKQADREKRRAQRALGFATILGAIGWCGFWFMVGCWWWNRG